MIIIKNFFSNIFTLILMLFYKVVYLEGKDSGYFLHKRKIAWFLFFIPILFIRMVINFFLEIQNLFKHIYSYDRSWISASKLKPKKLTFYQKKHITKRLMS
jgi:hypothetical protein